MMMFDTPTRTRTGPWTLPLVVVGPTTSSVKEGVGDLLPFLSFVSTCLLQLCIPAFKEAVVRRWMDVSQSGASVGTTCQSS